MAAGVQRDVTGAAAVAPGDPVVRVDGLTRSFGDRQIIRGLDLEIRRGEFVALLGASGCGKSTLLRVLAGLDSEIGGDVQVARRRAVAFQQPRLLPWKKVWRNVVLGTSPKQDREGARAALAEVGLGERIDDWPKTLSGGEAQRAALARALVRDPDLMLLDEPFAALDAHTRLTAQRLVAQLWARHGMAVLIVTHDVDEALLLADRVLFMDQGRITHELAVTEARPRSAASEELQGHRADLLGWLGIGTGVGTDEAGPA